MKGLVFCRESEAPWARELFSIHPLMLPVCTKPIVEYLIDFFLILGVKDVRVVTDEPDPGLEKYYESGERWGLNISYGVAKANDDIELLLQKNKSFCLDTDLLICDGFSFLEYDKNYTYDNLIQFQTRLVQLGSVGHRLLFVPSGHGAGILEDQIEVQKADGIALRNINSVNDYFLLNLEVLTSSAHCYNIPGYNNEPDVFIGQNVEISKNVTVNKPVLIGSNVSIQSGTVIGPNVVIGSNVIIDSGTKLADSVILDNTYVGEELDLIEKIVLKNRLISPADSELMTFEDPVILTEIDEGLLVNFTRQVCHALVAMVLMIGQIVPFVVLKPLLVLVSKGSLHRVRVILSRAGRVKEVDQYCWSSQEGMEWWDRMFVSLSLDRFKHLFLVLSGEMLLVGNRLLDANKESQDMLNDFPGYLPGVFNYTEAEGLEPGSVEGEIAERYYSGKNSLILDLKILIKAISNRFH
ncbi:MAG: NDP-sugar synthase [Desulfobulbaceae bacterium]|nr:NDP-sugar synthase [Desulfobulbaceae bacterium]